MVAPSNAFTGEAGRFPWFRVSFAGGVDLRQGPSVEARGKTQSLGGSRHAMLGLCQLRPWQAKPS